MKIFDKPKQVINLPGNGNMDKLQMQGQDFFSNFDDELHVGKLFIYLYGEFCNSYAVYANINSDSFLKQIFEIYQLSEKSFIRKEEFSKQKKIDEIDYNSSSYLILLKEKLVLSVNNYKIVFYYSSESITFEEINKIISLVKQNKKENKHKQKFYMISANSHSEYGFEFRKFNIKKQELNLTDNYNNDFIEVDQVIRNFLNADKTNGLVLLHGKYGTGKTSYIRHLMNTINRRFIFLPINMMESISSPNFLPFISKNGNSVLVLEDCETIIKQRETGNSDSSLVNLLNLGDGLLSDALSIKLICTFNADLKNIDKAILRKGRLVARYEFKELSVEKTTNLLNKIGHNVVPEAPKTLAEIFNYESNNFEENNDNRKIGF
ncbi:MAG: AAA family ATPase [Bacteroidales bacterium]